MEKVRLGKTELMVSRVGFGGIPIQRLTEAEAVRVVQSCVDMGITFIDTANAYTTSEERIGRAIASIPGLRHEVVIATKTGARDRDGAQAHLELSLERLQTDYVDLWQFHGVSTPEALAQVLGPKGAMEAALRAQEAGQVRHIGVSSHSMEVALQMAPMGHFETIQFPFNFVTREPADELLPLAQAHDLGFIAMKPFAGGLLGKANLSIKYLLQFEGVVPDPGIETADEMAEIVGILEGEWALTPRERGEIQDIRNELGTRFCRRCEYCQPCPQEIPISTVMNLRSFYRRFPPERFFSGRFPQTVERAKTCLECGDCEERCPYHLPIREMLVENVAFYESLAR
jgi:predicted aldo/keto reductase-like oxidoreductase